MSTADFGIITALISASLLLSTIGTFGQTTSIIRFAPELLEKKDGFSSETKEIINRSFSLAALGLTTTLIITASVILLVKLFKIYDPPLYMFLGLPLIPLLGTIEMQACLARVWAFIIIALSPKEILFRSLTIFIIFLVYLHDPSTKIRPELVIVTMIATLSILIYAQGLFLYRQIPAPKLILGNKEKAPKEWRKAVFPFWINSLTPVFLFNADIVVVALILGGEASAYYFLVNRITFLCTSFMMSQNTASGPSLSRNWHAGRFTWMQTHVKKIARRAFLITFASATVIFFLFPIFLEIFGQSFENSRDILYVFLLSHLAVSYFGPAPLLLDMTGNEKSNLKINMCVIILGTPTLVIGTLTIGLMGASIAVFMMSFFSRYAASRQLRLVTGLKSSAL